MNVLLRLVMCALVGFTLTGCHHGCETPTTPNLTFSQEAAHLKVTVSDDASTVTLTFAYDDRSVCPVFEGSATVDGVRMTLAEPGLQTFYTGDGSSGDCNAEDSCGTTEFHLPTAQLPSSGAAGMLDFVVTDSGGTEHITVESNAVTTCDFAACSST